MTVTSFYYLLMIAFGIIIYYILPKKSQWIVLLALSMFFYFCAAPKKSIIYIIASVVIAYVSTMLMEKYRDQKKYIACCSYIAILLNIFLWFIQKGGAFIHANVANATVALGVGYYTAQVIGYILDCYWETTVLQKNIFKLFLFVCFFPQLTVGPISKYNQLQSLYDQHSFSYQNLCFGSQRILWGLFKKLVISDRIAIITNGIWEQPKEYFGVWLWIAVLLYPIQIYGDFSGCVDIVLGTAELFDIHLPENFNNPFKARSAQEFWQRWHITLGTWAKDYVYYPVLKSKLLIKTGKWAKKHFSKRIAKFIPWAIGMGVLWFVMGFWHGSTRHIAGVSLWYWTILILGELFAPLLKRANDLLNVDTESYSWVLFQRIRTYLIFSLGSVFFAASGFMAALLRYKDLFSSFLSFRMYTLFDNSILDTGITFTDINIIVIGIIIIYVIDSLKEHQKLSVRHLISKQILPFRWVLWIGLLFFVLIYGLYGPGYEASTFIYQGF